MGVALPLTRASIAASTSSSRSWNGWPRCWAAGQLTHSNVLAGLIRAARAEGVPVRSLDETMRRELQPQGVATNAHFIGDAGAEAYWTLERFEEVTGSASDCRSP
jgi:hypothetical protein